MSMYESYLMCFILGPDESSVIFEFPSTSVAEFEKACNDEGGMFLKENELDLSCKTPESDEISVTIVNAASCVANIDDCDGIEFVESFNDTLIEMNIACEAQNTNDELNDSEGTQKSDVDNEDNINDDEGSDGTDKTSDDANEIVSDEDMDSDSESMSDSISDSLSDSLSESDSDDNSAENDMAMATTSSAAFSKVGKKTGPTIGIILLVILCLGGVWMLVRLCCRSNQEAKSTPQASKLKEVESTNTEEDIA